LRPHELLEASVATCMAISARMALADLGVPDGEVRVRVHLERERSASR
jgi:putative redox protein